MELKKYKLSDVATVEISNVDKKIKEGEASVRLCNFTDVYYNWAVTKEMANSFMEASASEKQIERFSLKKGQVALTKDSETRYDIGIPTYIADDFENVILGYHCALITPDENKISGKYLNAFMNSPYIQKYFANSASGSGQRYALSIETLESMPLLLPSLDEQKKIGELFSSLDRKISLNLAINANLESLAKQIYDYWFVQFDFPDDEGKPYKSNGGTMAWNDKLKREIPADWNVKSLEEIGSFKNGINYSKNEIGDKEYKIVNVRNISSSSLFIDTQNLDSICLKSNTADNFLVNDNDILIARSGTPGATRIIQEESSLVIFCGFIICFSIKEKMLKPLLLYQLKNLEQVTKIQSNGSILSNISQDVLKKLYAFIPKNKVIQKFNCLIKPLWNKLDKSINETNNLIHQRDELLPLLMNGQVTIE